MNAVQFAHSSLTPAPSDMIPTEVSDILTWSANRVVALSVDGLLIECDPTTSQDPDIQWHLQSDRAQWIRHLLNRTLINSERYDWIPRKEQPQNIELNALDMKLNARIHYGWPFAPLRKMSLA
jgi:hypothetical protein